MLLFPRTSREYQNHWPSQLLQQVLYLLYFTPGLVEDPCLTASKTGKRHFSRLVLFSTKSTSRAYMDFNGVSQVRTPAQQKPVQYKLDSQLYVLSQTSTCHEVNISSYKLGQTQQKFNEEPKNYNFFNEKYKRNHIKCLPFLSILISLWSNNDD